MPTTIITIRTNPELAEKIAAIAKATDRSRNRVIEEALKQYVETQMWQIEGIRTAMASLANGEGIPHEQVMVEANALLDRLDDTLDEITSRPEYDPEHDHVSSGRKYNRWGFSRSHNRNCERSRGSGCDHPLGAGLG